MEKALSRDPLPRDQPHRLGVVLRSDFKSSNVVVTCLHI